MSTSRDETHEFSGDFGGAEHDARAIQAREEKVRAEFWDKLRRFAGRLPFADDLVAVYYCALDPDTPVRVRGTLLGALVYFILPTDAIPDVIAGLGFTDDAAVLAMVVSIVSNHIKPRHRAAAARALDKALPRDGDAA